MFPPGTPSWTRIGNWKLSGMEMFLELSFQLLCDDQLNSNSSAAVVTA